MLDPHLAGFHSSVKKVGAGGSIAENMVKGPRTDRSSPQ